MNSKHLSSTSNLVPSRLLVVLISGYGSNLQAILDACQSRELPAQVAAVISNKSSAYGLERARLAGVPAVYFPKTQAGERILDPWDRDPWDRGDYDARLAGLVQEFNPDYIVLAGWMRLLSSAFLAHFPERVINLHPALPGHFPGVDSIGRAYAAFQRGEIEYTGVMVHLVPDEGVDNGPVVGQEVVPIFPADSLADLEMRVHEVEHRLLIETLKSLLIRRLLS